MGKTKVLFCMQFLCNNRNVLILYQVRFDLTSLTCIGYQELTTKMCVLLLLVTFSNKTC